MHFFIIGKYNYQILGLNEINLMFPYVKKNNFAYLIPGRRHNLILIKGL
jgi:hypothetical protein